MLNELHQVVIAMEKRRVPLVVPHSALEPMGKSELLLIEVDAQAVPERLKVLPSGDAGKLARVTHDSKGSSFPGFNLPLPLRSIPKKVELTSLGALVEAQGSKNASGSDIAKAAAALFPCTTTAVFSVAQAAQFRRSVQEMVGWLRADFTNGGPELENLRKLLDVIAKAKLELSVFAERLATCICQGDFTRKEWAVFAEVLFGKTHLPKCKDPLGSDGYWRAKKAADEKLQVPVFLDLADQNVQALPVADPRTGRLINDYLLANQPPPYAATARANTAPSLPRKKVSIKTPIPARDAYSGQDCAVAAKFPEPKLALLGNTKLFSNNTTEAGCFFRYGLGDADTFKVSAELVQKMSGAIFTLAGDDLALTALGGRPSVGRTCRGIPGGRKKKQDLLIAYLEDEPDALDPYVDLFGSATEGLDAPDFAATARPVLNALAGKVAANPNQLIRLIAIAPIDKANSQLSLNRSFTVRDVMEAAEAWQAGAANCPPVTLPFFDKQTKKVVWKSRTVPSPLDTASLLNRVWASSSDGGFRSDFQRIISVSDAYDIFLALPLLHEAKTRFALQILLQRMRDVFAASGRLKATSNFKALNEPSRWQVLKGIGLLGILLNQIKEHWSIFMKEPTYQLGRLLAYADSLHQQYCKHVRGGDSPTQLIGNALFNTALEQPVFALARLAERLVPYQAWAKTFRNTNPELKSGYEKTLLKLIGECSAHFIEEHDGAFAIRLDELPPRMTDTDKAKLLLGYLADHPKSDSKEE